MAVVSVVATFMILLLLLLAVAVAVAVAVADTFTCTQSRGLGGLCSRMAVAMAVFDGLVAVGCTTTCFIITCTSCSGST